jgi:hypothetical protein
VNESIKRRNVKKQPRRRRRRYEKTFSVDDFQ